MAIIRALGFLQIDTIRNVVRAQDHILWSRAQSYREGAVWAHLANRDLFEHFTHDASLIPRDILPLWGRRFRDLGARAAKAAWYQSGLGQAEISSIRERIERDGALSTHAFDTKATSKEMWARPPHKKALDQMWYAGELATCHRKNFVKFYDLGARVLGEVDAVKGAEAQLHRRALQHLCFATHGEIARFWDLAKPGEVKPWCDTAQAVPVEIELADGSWRPSLAAPNIRERMKNLPSLSTRLRIINPFDPAFRDRARTERLFGFSYRNEMFVPRAQRTYGYYVYPLLEGDHFVGRLEARADAGKTRLEVLGFWPEAGTRWGSGRLARLEAELGRFARLGGLAAVTWACDRPG